MINAEMSVLSKPAKRIRSAMIPANISRVTMILVVVLHLGEVDACLFAIFTDSSFN